MSRQVVRLPLVATPMSARAASGPDSLTFAHRAQSLPGDVVEAAVHLCADECRGATAQVLAMDGGSGVRGGWG
jgi:hypothetical protein